MTAMIAFSCFPVGTDQWEIPDIFLASLRKLKNMLKTHLKTELS